MIGDAGDKSSHKRMSSLTGLYEVASLPEFHAHVLTGLQNDAS
jgi:hypothetical protein